MIIAKENTIHNIKINEETIEKLNRFKQITENNN